MAGRSFLTYPLHGTMYRRLENFTDTSVFVFLEYLRPSTIGRDIQGAFLIADWKLAFGLKEYRGREKKLLCVDIDIYTLALPCNKL